MASRVTELIVPLLRGADTAVRDIDGRPPGERGLYAHAADAIEALDHECQLGMATIAEERTRAETAESKAARLEEALEAVARVLTKSSLIADERVFDALTVVRRAQAALDLTRIDGDPT